VILLGDCRAILPTLDAGSVRCCVTSPPYWGLRDYGVDGQIGLEKTPEAYVAELVAVFREVRRVLADDGTLWLNLGDSYAAQRGGTTMPAETLAGGIGGRGPKESMRGRGEYLPSDAVDSEARETNQTRVAHRNAAAIGLKHKDLVGIPWRVAFALQADGWYLRQDIIWHKPNPMPESVRDRCTKAHEYIFLLSKRERYYFDADAIAEPQSSDGFGGFSNKESLKSVRLDASHKPSLINAENDGKRNKRSVWTIPTQPTPDAHFATFPEALAERCILAGSAQRDTVLDPFVGSGTVGKVAERLGRKWIGIELNEAYTNIAKKKTAQMGLLKEG
jgi:DNA modification methylase